MDAKKKNLIKRVFVPNVRKAIIKMAPFVENVRNFVLNVII